MTPAEAKATFAKFVAADSSPAAIVAIVELLFDKIAAAIEADQAELARFRAKAETERIRDSAYKRRKRASVGHPSDVRRRLARARAFFIDLRKED